MEKYDLVIVLGAQIKKENGKYLLAPHTELRARAAAIAYHERISDKFIISGGYNFLVRYSETKILEKPDFSFEAFTKSRGWRSEADLIKEYMIGLDVSEEAIFLEELSATTEETAEILKILLKRSTFAFAKKIAISTLIYHMERALPIFRKAGLDIEPLFAEDLLALEGKSGIEKVCQYYSVPKGGKQWPVDKIRELLSSGRSIGELLRK